MMQKDIEWGAVLKAYITSGLTQQEFCAAHQLSFGKFKYHWDRSGDKSQVKTTATKIETMESCVFEPVSIQTESVASSLKHDIFELAIHLPNNIRCNLKLDLHQNELAKLLHQLGGV